MCVRARACVRVRARVYNCSSTTAAATTFCLRVWAELNKVVKRSVKRDKKDFVERLAGQAEEAEEKRNLKELYDITRKLVGTRRQDERQVTHKTGQLLTNQADQLNNNNNNYY